MKRVCAVIVTLSMFAAAAAFLAAADGKPVMAVKTFETDQNYYNNTVGSGLTDMFITELQKTGKYTLIERAQVDQLMDEVDFGKSGYVEQATAVRKGHIKGVQYYFLAKITNFGAKSGKTGGSGWGGSVFGGLGVKKDEAYVRIDFRIIDATSAETVMADSGEGTYKKSGVSMDGGVWGSGGGSFDHTSSEFRDSMLGRATTMAMNNIIDKMDHSFLATHTSRADELAQSEAQAQQEAIEALRKTPGTIMAVVSPQMIIIDFGSNKGIRVGDEFIVFKNEDIKNSKGEVVYTEEKEVGRLSVFEVQSDRSKTRLISGTDVKEGYTIKLK